MQPPSPAPNEGKGGGGGGSSSSSELHEGRSLDIESDTSEQSTSSSSSSSSTSASGNTSSPVKRGEPWSVIFRQANWRMAELPPLSVEAFLRPSAAQVVPYLQPCWFHRIVSGEWEKVEGHVVVQQEPFAAGCMRHAYYCLEARTMGTTLWVAKRYIKANIDDEQYFNDVEMHSIAAYYAAQYNAKAPKSVNFLPALVMELIIPSSNSGGTGGGRVSMGSSTPPPPSDGASSPAAAAAQHHHPSSGPLVSSIFFAIEPYMKGSFVKHNNNNGYVNPKVFKCSPHAFSHFTFHASQGRQLVCDVQGVGEFYTDPQIVTKDGVGFGKGNLGRRGMRHFKRTHICNSVCVALGLEPFTVGPPLEIGQREVGPAGLNAKQEGPNSNVPSQQLSTPKRTLTGVGSVLSALKSHMQKLRGSGKKSKRETTANSRESETESARPRLAVTPIPTQMEREAIQQLGAHLQTELDRLLSNEIAFIPANVQGTATSPSTPPPQKTALGPIRFQTPRDDAIATGTPQRPPAASTPPPSAVSTPTRAMVTSPSPAKESAAAVGPQPPRRDLLFRHVYGYDPRDELL